MPRTRGEPHPDKGADMLSSTYPYMPPWLLAIIFFLGLLAARAVGRYARARWHPPGETDSFAVTSVLGLLALLIGFTFSIALSRYESRRELVFKEANALGTTWLRMDLLEGDERARMKELLRRYVDARIDFGRAETAAEETRQFQRTATLQAELWAALMAAVVPFRDTPRALLLVTTTNQSIDLAAERYAVRQSHIPSRILRLLMIFALLAAAMVGYEHGKQWRSTTLLFVLLTLAVSLVMDLDSPSTGITNVSQQPMIDLRAMMDASAGKAGVREHFPQPDSQ